MYPLNQPEVMVAFAQERIDNNGKVTDPKTREKIRELLGSLVAWAKRFKPSEESLRKDEERKAASSRYSIIRT